jgi:hypothetical protein
MYCTSYSNKLWCFYIRSSHFFRFLHIFKPSNCSHYLLLQRILGVYIYIYPHGCTEQEDTTHSLLYCHEWIDQFTFCVASHFCPKTVNPDWPNEISRSGNAGCWTGIFLCLFFVYTMKRGQKWGCTSPPPSRTRSSNTVRAH